MMRAGARTGPKEAADDGGPDGRGNRAAELTGVALALELTDPGRERLARLTAAMDGLQAGITAAFGGPEAEAELHTLIHRLPAAPAGSP